MQNLTTDLNTVISELNKFAETPVLMTFLKNYQIIN